MADAVGHTVTCAEADECKWPLSTHFDTTRRSTQHLALAPSRGVSKRGDGQRRPHSRPFSSPGLRLQGHVPTKPDDWTGLGGDGGALRPTGGASVPLQNSYDQRTHDVESGRRINLWFFSKFRVAQTRTRQDRNVI